MYGLTALRLTLTFMDVVLERGEFRSEPQRERVSTRIAKTKVYVLYREQVCEHSLVRRLVVGWTSLLLGLEVGFYRGVLLL